LVIITHDKGTFTEEDIKQLVGSRPIAGQMIIETEADKNVPESGTFEETQNETVSALAAGIENVPESGTFQETQGKPVSTLAAGIEDVPESVTSEETRSESIPASEELPDDTFSEEYTLATVKQLTEKYRSYYNMAVEEGIRTRLISECRCLLDALDLLKKKLVEDENNHCDDGN
ncbi:MAG: hypothetical protein K2M91_01830, partial [Lachnospiraceae bacterium]|nr:hypothetical protein [Lachnospiraceae bacterium]